MYSVYWQSCRVYMKRISPSTWQGLPDVAKLTMHTALCMPWGQMADPPHSCQRLHEAYQSEYNSCQRTRAFRARSSRNNQAFWSAQRELPRVAAIAPAKLTLHRALCLSWGQICDPRHSCQRTRAFRVCSSRNNLAFWSAQRELPRVAAFAPAKLTLHWALCLSWGQMPCPPHSCQRSRDFRVRSSRRAHARCRNHSC